jgi:hypothetical protein
MQFKLPAGIQIGGFRETAQRFSLSIVCAWMLFLLVVIDGSPGYYAIWALYGFFWCGAARLFAESRNWPENKYRLLAAVGAAVLGGAVFLAGSEARAGLDVFYIVPVLLSSLMFAPFMNREKDDILFWNYNLRFFGGAAIAFVVAALLFGGGSLALSFFSGFIFPLKELLGGKNPVEYYFYFCAILFAPYFALSLVPSPPAVEEAKAEYPPVCRFFAGWILAPLTVLYIALLYIYFGKVLIQWKLPEGTLAPMICAFGTIGVVTCMIAWPIRDTGSRLTRFVCRNFFRLLIVPALFLFAGVFERIHAYGVTEQRYLLAMGGVWFAMLVGFFAMRPSAPLKFIPMAMAVLLLIAAGGPWGAASVSLHDQKARLEALLARNHLFAGGKIVPAKNEIPYEDNRAVFSILDYLRDRQQEDAIAPWFEIPDAKYNDVYRFDHGQDKKVREISFGATLGLAPLYKQGSGVLLDFSAPKAPYAEDTEIAGFDYFIKGGFYAASAREESDASRFVRVWNSGVLSVSDKKGRKVDFDLAAYIAPRMNENAPGRNAKAMIFEKSEAGLKVRLTVEKMSVMSHQNKKPEIRSFNYILLIGAD